jgi:hypothetical protein
MLLHSNPWKSWLPEASDQEKQLDYFLILEARFVLVNSFVLGRSSRFVDDT